MTSIVGIQKHYVIEVRSLPKVERLYESTLQNLVQCSVGITDMTKYIILFILCIVNFFIYIYQHMHMSFTRLQTIHTHGLVFVSVTNCRPQGDITEEYVILLLQIYIYSVRNIYNSNFIYINMDTVYSMMLACSLLKFNAMPLYTV